MSILLSYPPFVFTNLQDWNIMDGSFRIDVMEERDAYLVKAELPGTNKEDISLTLKDGQLVIDVRVQAEENSNTKNYVHLERLDYVMRRIVYLDNAKSEGITAKLNKGILKITVPKDENTNSSEIVIE